ncbi:MAG: hypothetical protein DMG55_30380 [Acidobacteria bacterium]|nr:MAG: hypothetical protein DMG55_30380 [Acidobacteriota bacterium]
MRSVEESTSVCPVNRKEENIRVDRCRGYFNHVKFELRLVNLLYVKIPLERRLATMTRQGLVHASPMAVKYEEVYLKDYVDVLEAMSNLKSYFTFYNHERPHQSLGYQTPAAIYFTKEKRT